MSDVPPSSPAAGNAAAPAADAPRAASALLLRGTSVAPGLVLGHAHRKDRDLALEQARRVPLDAVEQELNRFRRALDVSRNQLSDLKTRLEGKVRADDARILDTHVLYLKDSAFIADVERLVLSDQMNLEAAIAKVVGDFDRIFRLVQSETLRQSAVDLRDVGIRVLRNLESEDGAERERAPSEPYILVARELSIVDMFDLANRCVLGIATEEGGLTSHAAIFARSMRIPTLIGIEALLERVQEGDYLILDASEGALRVNPDEQVRAQYQAPGELALETAGEAAEALPPARTRDGELIQMRCACGNVPEVEQSARLGVQGVGLYRTELLYLLDKDPPSREALVRHYRSVVEHARGALVNFRLLHADSALRIAYLHEQREPNPSLGRLGVRLLLANELVLRRQLQAILLAAAGNPLRISVPFVNDCGELRRVKEILFDERLELRKGKEAFQDRVELGAVIETPAALLGLRDLARECDFLCVNLDALAQYLLAADRDHPQMSEWLEAPHPFVLRALIKTVSIANELRRPLLAFGASAADPAQLALWIGAGLREFCVTPASFREFAQGVRGLDARSAARMARAAARGTSSSELQALTEGYGQGYARG